MRAGGDAVEVSPANAECSRCDCELIGFARVDEGVTADREADCTAAESRSSAVPACCTDAACAHAPSIALDSAQDGRASQAFDPARVAESKCVLDPPQNNGSALVPTSAACGPEPAKESRAAQALASLDPSLGARGMLRLAARVFGMPLRSVTPRLRAAVRARDGWRCAVPGCTNFRFIEIHHPHRRADGGPTTLVNLLSLCSAHHRAVHEGLLAIEGSASEGYVVRHAGGTLYGAPRELSPSNPRGTARPIAETSRALTTN